jgi:hypothetical protein
MNENRVIHHIKRVIITLAASVLFVNGCTTISTGAHYDETTDFSTYRTFAWIGEDPYISGSNEPDVAPLTHAKIRSAIRMGLEDKGYQFLDERDRADFVVAYTIGTREEIYIESYPSPYYGPWGWHVRGSRYYVHDVAAHSYTRGTLSVDIFDGESKQPVWHGWAEKTVTVSDRKDPTAAINEGVAKLLGTFAR